jgi:hypothetical protein
MSDLLELAIDAHGGLDRWRAIETLDVRISLTGRLFRAKGYPEGVPNVLMRVYAHRIAVDVSPWTGLGTVGHFVPDRVWITDGGRNVIKERSDPRRSFAGHVPETPWDQLHRLYFTSYAIWNYLTTPFLFTLPGFELKEIEPHQESGETWRRLHVKFPPDIPTHNHFQVGGEQTFFFNEKGLLQRIDYLAVGPASHYCFDHTTFGGLVFPTLRRVVGRPQAIPLVSGPTAVLLQIADIAVS